LGTISPKATQRVGLLPSGTDLNNQALFGSLNPGMGWAPSWSEIADAWGSSGQVPIDYMLPYAKDHTARQVTEMLGSGASAADVWSKEGERLLKDFFNPKVPKDLNKAKGQTAYDAALAQWMASQPEMRFALK
jgi:hypothetical protein